MNGGQVTGNNDDKKGRRCAAQMFGDDDVQILKRKKQITKELKKKLNRNDL